MSMQQPMRSRNTLLRVFGLISLLFVTIAPSAAAADSAKRVEIIRDGSFSCEGGALEGYGVPGNGFAVINITPPSVLLAQLVLRDGLPDSTYSVRLIQSAGLGGSTADCDVEDGTLVTDASGNGQVNLREARLPDSIGAFVFLVHFPDATSPLDIQGTRLVLVD